MPRPNPPARPPRQRPRLFSGKSPRRAKTDRVIAGRRCEPVAVSGPDRTTGERAATQHTAIFVFDHTHILLVFSRCVFAFLIRFVAPLVLGYPLLIAEPIAIRRRFIPGHRVHWTVGSW